MGGFFGVIKKNKACVNELFYGVDYNSHLGTRRAGMATFDKEKCHFARQIHNIENSYFRTKFEADLPDFKGESGIGVISDTDAQPIIVNTRLGKFAIVTVARVTNIPEIENKLLSKGIHFCEHSRDTVNPTELIAALIAEGKDLTDGLRHVQDTVKGSCSMLVLTEGALIAARDRLGRTPIAIGYNEKEESYAASSETSAFANLGYKHIYDLGPAEIVRITPENGIEQLQAPGKEMQICAFLWTYYGYPPCSYEGRNVDEMRYECGRIMGNKCKSMDSDLDFVSPVPDSGTGMALGYASGAGKPYLRGLVKYTPTWPRSFTPGTQERRELVAKMKLIANGDLLKGKSVAFCDDSIVRGTQLRDNVKDVRDAGARAVHIRISCPPLIYPCDFINFTSSRGPMELIARRVIEHLEPNPSAEALKEYATAGTERYKAMVEEIRKDLGLDSLKFSSIEDLVKAIGLPRERVCTHCFDGTSHF
ncbi:MAG: amidophosphoribosyltransferase [Muribaculaceae bacterium]|nr:amidophosphoribosyltransferase [Muribaculaceae bacterium]